MGLKLNSASGSVILEAENVSGNNTITIPNETGTLLTSGATNLSLSDYLRLTSTTAPAHAEGTLFYDTDNKSLAVYNDESDVTLQVGQEQWVRVYNNSGATITNGQPVYFSGNNSEVPTIAIGNATNAAKYHIRGLATHDIENNSYGYVTDNGMVRGLDTSGLTQGGSVFLGLTDGALTSTEPSYPNYPQCIGACIVSDAQSGVIYVKLQAHTVESFRVVNNTHVGGNVIVDGDLTVSGTQTTTSSNNVSLGASFQYLNAGDTIGEANTTFTGSGLDDAYFSGHFDGATSTTYYVKIDATGTPDTFSWSKDNFATTEATGVSISASGNVLDNGISVEWGTTTGHTLNDVWSGTAAPADVDTGLWTNRNTGASGVGYTHMGFFFDASAGKWVLADEYDPEPSGTINTADASFSYATLKAGTFEGEINAAIFDTTSSKASVTGTLSINEVIEKVTIDNTMTGTINFDTLTQAVAYFYLTQTANRTVNFRGDASNSLNSVMADGESMTCSLAMRQGSNAFYLNAFQIDGASVTPKWAGGSAPTEGNASGIDVYTFTIIKRLDATFEVLASQTQYA